MQSNVLSIRRPHAATSSRTAEKRTSACNPEFGHRRFSVCDLMSADNRINVVTAEGGGERQQQKKTSSIRAGGRVLLRPLSGCPRAKETLLLLVDLQNCGWDLRRLANSSGGGIRRKPENIRRLGAFAHLTACATCLNSPCQAPALGTFNLEVKQHLHEAVADGGSRALLPPPPLPAGSSLSVHY